jgi:hypothetical protein
MSLINRFPAGAGIAWLGPGLLSQHLFDFAELFLGLSLGLLDDALGLQPVVTDQLSGSFLDGAGNGFGRTSDLVFSACFHDLDFPVESDG